MSFLHICTSPYNPTSLIKTKSLNVRYLKKSETEALFCLKVFSIHFICIPIHFVFIRLPAELHLVHVNEDYVSGSTILSGAFTDGEGLAVLAIFLENIDATNKTAAWFDVRP